MFPFLVSKYKRPVKLEAQATRNNGTNTSGNKLRGGHEPPSAAAVARCEVMSM